MSKTQSSIRFEKNIYVEKRCGAYRFIVKVHPLTDTSTFSTMDEGGLWARRRRVELLEEKAAIKKNNESTWSVSAKVAPSGPPLMTSVDPASIPMVTIFDSYLKFELPKLSGREVEASRIRNLQIWFGDLTLGQLDSAAFIEDWQLKRASGLLGSGRNPYRGDEFRKAEGAVNLTKQQRHRLKKTGALTEPELIFPVSTQTVRHDLAVLRRAIRAYFVRTPALKPHKHWLGEHEIMTMRMPAPAEARSQRLSDEEIKSIIGNLPTIELKSAVMFLLLTTLRRAEVLSLRWEDVDFIKSVVRLRALGHLHKKSKTTARDVPLVPGALKVLKDLGIKKVGPIFTVPIGSLTQAWRKAADAAEAFDIRLHDCRRESITRLAEKGKLIVTDIVAFSGHSNVSVLEKHYLRTDSAVVAQQVSKNQRMKNFMPTI